MMTNSKSLYTNSNTKRGDLVGYNVTCTAANGFEERFSLRAMAGETFRNVCDSLRAIDASYTSRGWTVTVEQVAAA